MDAVVTVAVELVNRLTPGDARGRAFQPPSGEALTAAVNAALRAGLPTAREVTAEEAAGFSAVARSLRAVFDANAADDADLAARRVNELLTRTGARPTLDKHDGEPWHLH